MTKPQESAARYTVYKTRRGAGADARARTEGKPGPGAIGSFRELSAGLPIERHPRNILTTKTGNIAGTPALDAFPDFVPSFAALAGVLNVNRAWLNDIRHRDRRFPVKGPKGWSVMAVFALLQLRDLDKQSDADFNAEHRAGARETIADADAGRLDHLGKDTVSRVRSVMADIIAGRFDYDPKTGLSAREGMVHEWTDTLQRNGTA